MPWEIESFLIQHPMGDKFAQVNESYHLIVLEVQICQERRKCNCCVFYKQVFFPKYID